MLSPEERARRVQAALTEFSAERSAGTRAQRKATKPTAPARLPVTSKSLVKLDDPAMFVDEDMRAALAARDVTVLYRLLYQRGVAQREIARRTGQSQSEVSDILTSRTVRDVTVLERIADGLGIPRAWMRLAGVAAGVEGSYGGEVTVADPAEEVIAEMFRRHLLALGAVAAAGAAGWAERLLGVPGTELQATALHYAGVATVEHGHPDDGLKMIQFSLVTTCDIPRDEQRAVVVGEIGRAAREATARTTAATAMAELGFLDAADVEMATSRQLWSPTRADPFGDLDRPASLLALRRGRLDAAESLAAASVRRWEGISQIGLTHSGVVLATIHVRAGEPDGLALAHDAITAVPKLSSVRVRKRLLPLADELASRPGTDAKDLSRMAHQVAAVRA